MPGVGHGAEHPLRVRHHDGGAAIRSGHGGDAVRRAVRVGRIVLGHLTAVIHETQPHQTAGLQRRQVSGIAHLHSPFPVGDGDRHHGTRHASEEGGRRVLYFHQAEARLETLGAVAHEARPQIGARDQLAQVGHHLAAVAHPQRERIAALEEALELLAGAIVEQDGLGPAFTRPQHVAVGEAATGHQGLELLQLDTAGEDIAHMHVDGGEAGAVKRRRHLHVGVDPLLAQHRQTWRGPLGDIGRRHIFGRVVAELGLQARIGGVLTGGMLLIRTLGVIAQALHLPAGLAPDGAKGGAAGAIDLAAGPLEQDEIPLTHRAQHVGAGRQTVTGQQGHHRFLVFTTHLDDGTQLLVEQGRQQVATDTIQLQVEATVTGEGHLHQGDEQAAVGAVVIGDQLAIGHQRLDGVEEALELDRVVQIRGALPKLAIDLGQGGGAEALLAVAKVDEDKVGFTKIAAQLRGDSVAHVLDPGKGGDEQGERRGDALLLAILLPAGLHGHGVLAHRNGDAKGRAELLAHRLDRLVETGIFPRVTGSGHPVGGELDPLEGTDVSRCQVGQGLGHRHTGGSGVGEQRHRGAFAHGHGFAMVAVVGSGGDGAIGHRDLPGADHLVAVDQTGHAAIADGDEEGFLRHGGQTQYPLGGVAEGDAIQLQCLALGRQARYVAVHLGGLAQQHVQRQIDGVVVKVIIRESEMLLFGGGTDDGIGCTLALAQGLEQRQLVLGDGQYVTLLGFVAPDLQRAHARLVIRDGTQIETAPAIAVAHQLRHGVGEAAGAHVVNKDDGVVVPQLPAAIDHLLAAALHLRVVTLHRGKVEILGGLTGGHGGCRAAAQTDVHGRSPQHDEGRAHRDLPFLDVLGTDVADAARQHDGLVVATHLDAVVARHLLFEGTEVTENGRTAELVVKRRPAKRPFLHDVKGADDAARFAEVLLPGLLEAGDTQVGDGEAHQTRLGLGAAPGGTLVANFAARTGGSSRERRDGGRVVVGLHLHQDVDLLLVVLVLTVGRAWEEAAGLAPFHHGGVVFISRQDMIRRLLEGVLDHLEQRLGLQLTIDGPVGVEDLVAAVLGVCLGKHVELDVVGVAAKPGEVLHQIVDFVIGQGQTQGHVGLHQGGAATGQHVHLGEVARLLMGKQGGGLVHLAKHHLHHAIVQHGGHVGALGSAQLILGLHVIGDAALEPLDLGQAAVVGDVGCFGRPGGDSAGAGVTRNSWPLGVCSGMVGP